MLRTLKVFVRKDLFFVNFGLSLNEIAFLYIGLFVKGLSLSIAIKLESCISYVGNLESEVFFFSALTDSKNPCFLRELFYCGFKSGLKRLLSSVFICGYSNGEFVL